MLSTQAICKKLRWLEIAEGFQKLAREQGDDALAESMDQAIADVRAELRQHARERAQAYCE